jgi:hypothetical protein
MGRLAVGSSRAVPRVSRRPILPLEATVSLDYKRTMPDDLYDRDVLVWSEQQAALLRRAARGERVNDIDWDHVVEEIEDVGLSELHAVHSYLEQLLAHLLKLRGWPGLSACNHWRSEIVTFQAGAARRFAPSMRQRIELGDLYRIAVQQVEPLRYGGHPGLKPPETCPVGLDQLLTSPRAELEAVFCAADAGGQAGSEGSASSP